ncbi:MAG: hypothetical protein ACREF4_22370, partial [Gammaproteobacteria bacterium]
TGESMYNQAAALELDFDAAEIAAALDPAVDDQQTRNDVTVVRREGSRFRAVDEVGPLGVDAIGSYDTQVTINPVGDTFLPNQAGWRLHLGTTDDDRWPKVSVDLDAAPTLADAVSAVRPGDRIDLVNLPVTLAAAGSASLLVQGWTEELGSHRRTVTFNCTPESPWRVGKYAAAAGATGSKYDTDGSQLAAAVTASATTFDVATTRGPLWTGVDAEDGFDIHVGGERMTVTDIVTEASPQTFTVIRWVNGVVKAHPAGAPVRLWQPARYALRGIP